jgi:secondary thiamine-phosphate synthase enzyme
LNKFERGFHIITDLIVDKIGNLPSGGVLHLFIQHTSAGLCINENCDPDVLADFESFFNKIVPENMPFLKHTVEGPDDMPAHVKSSMVGHSISIPIKDGKLMLGVWQGIYLCEFRNHASPRNLVATIIS